MKTTTAHKPQEQGQQGGQSQSQRRQSIAPETTMLKHATSAVGAHMDDETAIAVMAYKLDQEEGSSGSKKSEHWKRAREEFDRQHAVPAPAVSHRQSGANEAFDREVEEAMHLDR